MLFIEFKFLAFFAVVFGLYWTARRLPQRKVLLLAASYLFYAAWDWRFLGLIMLSTIVDYTAGLRMGAAGDATIRRRWLLFSLVVNLGMLGLFKYFDFFVGSMQDLVSVLGFTWRTETLSIILPVGISFYTFQTLSYTIDVYRGSLQPRRSLLDIAVFVAFFPQLVAGPILRAREFLPQLDKSRVWASVPVRACLLLFLVGFVKKACVSDNLAPFIDAIFAAPGEFTRLSVAGAALLYAVQIYCDFSGYSDMAIATGSLLGFSLPGNFDGPYFARSVTAFWRRWHMTLSSWLRDYLYIALGGNRGGAAKTCRNLMITMVLGGLWHGAAYTFVIWGFLHGLALMICVAWTRTRAPRLPAGVGIVLTFLWVDAAWIFFRAETPGDALTMLGMLTGQVAAGTASLPWNPVLVFAVCAAAHGIARWASGWRARPSLPAPVFALLYGAAWAFALAAMATGTRPFIYFQF